MSMNLIRMKEIEKRKKLKEWFSSTKNKKDNFIKKMMLDSKLIITEIEPVEKVNIFTLDHYKVKAIVNNKKISVIVNNTESIDCILKLIMSVYYFLEKDSDQLSLNLVQGKKNGN